MLVVAGSRKRILRQLDGEPIILIIRRLKCEHCHRIHHELPDTVVPYKRHCAETIEEILSDTEEKIYPCESSTAVRLRNWFSLLREHFEKALVAVQYRYKQDGRLSQELSTLLPLVPAFLPAGWLGRLVRTLVNAGFYPQTRSA